MNESTESVDWSSEFGVSIFVTQFKAEFTLWHELREKMNDCAECLRGCQLTEHQKAHLTILCYSVRALASLGIVCNAGHGQDGRIFNRILFQHMVWMFYLLADPGRRVLLFNNNSKLTWMLIREETTNPDKWAFEATLKDPETMRIENAKAYSELRDVLSRSGLSLPINVSELRPLLSGSWALIPFGKIVEAVVDEQKDHPQFVSALKDIYGQDFWFDSQMTHTAGVYYDTLVTESESEITYDPRPTDFLVRESLLTGLKYGSKILSVFSHINKKELGDQKCTDTLAFEAKVRSLGRAAGLFRSIAEV